MGLNVGSAISTLDGQGHAIIASGRSVLYEEQEVSLAEATRRVYGASAKSQGQWSFEGKPLDEIYEETYPKDN